MILLLFSFLGKFYEVSKEKKRKDWIVLFFYQPLYNETIFVLLGYSQNLIVFNRSLSKNVLRSFAIAIDCTWYRCVDESKICWAK